ncbi:MmgE/PrpD family protein [Caballeronia hypogeia]|uniref:MmgE/PrpD family protein n=1 Tax=Caballeronia hypogeia TaxID=1777140 RepID=A0A158CFF1_9BURK|nr:MmgE/PrpD family protein [Caballeronia hypogeia]SAK81010.1 MmgE/PrpD family protein [Caballeronia hypogeia]
MAAYSNFSTGRRKLLARALIALAGAAIGKGSRAADAPSSVMLQLGAYLAEAGSRPLPDDVLEKSKHHIVDTFAAMISGSLLPPGSAALQYARTGGERGGVATIIASTLTAGPVEAAFVNAMLAQSDETDDSNEFSQSHPGCAIVPAAFAMAEKFGVDGNRFVRAVTLGYDVGPRVTISFRALDFRNNSHKSTHAIAEVFGSAAAAGCIAGLDAHKMQWLLDYTAQQSAGIGAWTRDTQHMEKAFVFAGMPAKNGVMAALLVDSGFTGLDDIFSGTDNYFLAYAPNANPDELIKDLGKRYEIARTNIKKWSVGSPIQAPLDAMDNIFKKYEVAPENVRSIVVRLAHTEARIVDNREIPDICLQHMVSVMLLDKTVSFKAAHDKARMGDPEILRVRAKVELVSSDELEALEPARHGIVEITLNDGTMLTDHVAHVRGTADNPMDRGEVVRKATDLMEPVLGKANSTELIDKLMTLEKLNNLRGLRRFLQRA